MIKRLTCGSAPRIFRVVALPAPTDRQKTRIHMQRSIEQLLTAGEMLIFDRRLCNRPGVARPTGYCTDETAKRFLAEIPHLEGLITESGTRAPSTAPHEMAIVIAPFTVTSRQAGCLSSPAARSAKPLR